MPFDSEVNASPPREAARGRGGIVASAHALVSQVALEVLRGGGNAADAAVAGAAMLMLVEPRNGHLGGEAFVLVDRGETHEVVALNGSGAAPAAATYERYRALGAMPTYGILSATVPGVVSTWAHLLERFGTRSLAELLQPAIDYAENGIVVGERFAYLMELDAPMYREFPSSARVFIPDGRIPAVGDVFRQPDFARSLKAVARDGRAAFYEGEIAREMVRFSHENGGLFELSDFAEHRTEESPPLSVSYRGYRVFEQPPVSQGIIVLCALKIVECFDLAAMGPQSVAATHVLIEALKLAFEDRMRHLGDPHFVENPLAWLLSEEHAREQAARIDLRRAAPGNIPAAVAPDTTYMAVGDASGTVVSYIHTLFSNAGIIMGSTGALMNSRMRGFHLEPGHPNCVAPRKRPIHTLNSFIVHEGGTPVLAGGTPGAHWQVQTNLQMLTNVLDFGMGIQDAIEAPRFTVGTQYSIDRPEVKLESRAAGVAEGLRALGHEVESVGPWEAGGAVQLLAPNAATGVYAGATEPRRAPCTVLAY